MDPRAAPLRLALAAALIAFMAATAPVWSDAAALWRAGDYAATRIRVAFQGLPVDALAEAIDARLAPGEPIALAPALRANEVVLQRLTEALYPRRIDAAATSVLDAVPAFPTDPRVGAPLARMDDLVFVLRGDRAPTATAQAARRGGSWPAVLGSALGALGLGLLLRDLLARRVPLDPAHALPVAVLLGALVQGLLASAATWFQLPLPRVALAALGLAGFARAAWRARAATAGLGRWLRVPEHALFAVLLGGLLARAVRLPISGWDGRSIWLFQAHRLFAHGFVPLDELRAPETLWSHPDYPLLLPGWLASFSALAPAFDERAAALAIAVLLGACLALLWQLARPLLGRDAAVAYALALWLAIGHATAGGYADGFLLCFLTIQFLAFASRGHAAVGWLAAAAASLVKAEGLVLAGSLAALFAVDAWRRGELAPRRRLPVFLVLAPAAVHAVWTRAQGMDSVFRGQDAGATVATFVPRVAEALHAMPGLWHGQGPTQVRALLWVASAALVVTAGLWASRRRAPRSVTLALAAAAGWTAFAVAAVSGLPEAPRWFVETALDRLLLHPAALLLLVPVLWLPPAHRREP
jgi:hypothetical protein